VEGKTVAEVTKYHKVFCDRYQELDGWEKILKGIERFEKIRERIQEVRKLLDEKVQSCQSPEESLKLPPSVSQKRGFIDDNDRFILTCLQRLGYGDDQVYEMIQLEIRKSAKFRFDYYFKSRNPDDLKKRSEILIKALEREKAEAEKEKEKAKQQAKEKKGLLETSKKRSSSASAAAEEPSKKRSRESGASSSETPSKKKK